jgi:hypothetical protein
MVEGDLRRRIRTLPVVVVLVALLAITAVASALTTSGLAAPGQGNSCGDAVLRDWRTDGAIGRSYEAGCYLDAIESLPEDVRAYTSAEEDIERALQVHVDESTRQSGEPERRLSSAGAATTAPESSTLRLPPLPVLILGGVLVVGTFAVALPAFVRRR